jgi:hypothetical protein
MVFSFRAINRHLPSPGTLVRPTVGRGYPEAVSSTTPTSGAPGEHKNSRVYWGQPTRGNHAFRVKPPKLGQCDLEATTKCVDSQGIATPKVPLIHPRATFDPSARQLQAACTPGAWEVPSCTALVYLLFSSYSPLVLRWAPPPCGRRSTERLPVIDSSGGRVIQRKSRLSRGARESEDSVRVMRKGTGQMITEEDSDIQSVLSQILLAWKS